jgi:hypothetical protein
MKTFSKDIVQNSGKSNSSTGGSKEEEVFELLKIPSKSRKRQTRGYMTSSGGQLFLWLKFARNDVRGYLQVFSVCFRD